MYNYYGLTIGPIVQTISSTSKPAGLWMASYFFSTITRDLCMEIYEKEKATIISPYFDINEKDIDGIGKYNDRIIVRVEEEKFDFENELKNCIENVKNKKGEEIADCLLTEKENINEKENIKEYVKNYIYVQYICLSEADIDNNNVLSSVSSVLDGLELMVPVPMQEGKQYILRLIENNKYVTKYSEFNGAKSFLQVNPKEENIKDLKSISIGDNKNDMKYTSYFAIVYADGDRMGTVVEKLGKESDEESIKAQIDFSNKCIDYTKESANLIIEYGGVPIYAGGDDLFFIAPLVRNNKEIVFELCQKITDKFNDKFDKEIKELGENGPSLSFGISINYYKYPLYEAIEDARRLLFVNAKGTVGSKERIYNSIAVHLQKSSGQSLELVLKQSGDSMKKFIELLKKQFLNESNENTNVNLKTNSSIFTLENYKKIICNLWGREDLLNVDIEPIFKNFFDNIHQEKNDDWSNQLIALSNSISNDLKNNTIRMVESSEGRNHGEEVVDILTCMLRICKFFVEKKGEDI